MVAHLSPANDCGIFNLSFFHCILIITYLVFSLLYRLVATTSNIWFIKPICLHSQATSHQCSQFPGFEFSVFGSSFSRIWEDRPMMDRLCISLVHSTGMTGPGSVQA